VDKIIKGAKPAEIGQCSLVSSTRNSFKKSFGLYRRAGETRHPEVFKIPEFRVALAAASLPGMTLELFKPISETGH